MRVSEIKNNLMNYILKFNARNGARDSSGYLEAYIGFADDVLWLYGHKVHIEDYSKYIGVKKIIVTRLKQNVFDEVIEYFKNDIEEIFLWKAPLIHDFSILEKLVNLKFVVGFWNTKATKLWQMNKNTKLEGISLASFSKINNLLDFSNCSIRELAFTGNPATLQKVKLYNLDTLLTMQNLIFLELWSVKIPEQTFEVLLKLINLKELYLNANEFKTEQFAMLSVKLTNINVHNLGPYWEKGENVIILGSRKPMLNKNKDKEKIDKYVEEFALLQQKYK
ncbi:MAG: hypothetical protein A2084_00900 [Tenericutes bacterium GWC2_39_45]|nr:MAG: hypothetical protein A2Y43_00950 [Tenericutes bacterium GWA2_38_26]OHE30363.1 MAG: hypothetical protein A2084_00900 [Tenericutes bacterium GWC2_39_45]OHE41160.1 MAG: hypothetical protein A2102_01215 [Tenericutes bacterium GWF2_38_8]HBG32179.1 hypothetical protein [Acholeplasmataceae bacterium]HCB66672.1 hypothetical protein [Acholeplasmataceae bacterium]